MQISVDPHTRARMRVRGISEEEVVEVIQHGAPVPATQGRVAKEKVFPFRSAWRGRFYTHKKVRVVYVEEEGVAIAVTAIAYYGEWKV